MSTCQKCTYCSGKADNQRMETRRLELLAELSRLGSMRAVADALGTTTSTVSQQLAALAREMGTQLTEPDGRRVRLTPAGRLLAEHAVTILAEVEAARRDLSPGAEPVGTLRVAGFATAIRSYLLPVIAGVAASHPRIHVLIREHEPAEALQLLAADRADLALTYDYNLAPAATDPAITLSPLWTALWGLGVPEHEAADGGTAPEVFARFRARDWIGNSRNTADEDVIRTLASMAGFTPRITHRADSLDLVQDMITAGLGVGLLPLGHPVRPGVRLLPLAGPGIELRAYAAARRGRLSWPPLALVVSLLRQASRQATRGLGHSPPVVRDDELDLGEGADAGDRAADDKGLHRLRALEGVDRLQVHHVPHDLVVEQDAVPAEHVAGLGGDPAGLAGVVHLRQPGHRGGQAACFGQAADLQAVQLHRGEVGQHLHQPLLDDLKAGQRLAELAPLLRVPQGRVVGGGRVAERRPGAGAPGGGEYPGRVLERAGTGQPVPGRHPHLVQRDLGLPHRAQRYLPLDDPGLVAGCAFLHHEGVDLSVFGVPGPHADQGGDAAKADPPLAAVQHPAVAVRAGRGFQGDRV